MILLTVGAQMPFDRLGRAVDDWAGARGRSDVFAQIGATAWRPSHLRWSARLSPSDFRHLVLEADAVVTHAGIGTILTALELGKPVLVLPRRGGLLETRNDHQLATARAFEREGRVSVAWNEEDLAGALDDLPRLPAPPRLPAHASVQLLETIRHFVHAGDVPTNCP